MKNRNVQTIVRVASGITLAAVVLLSALIQPVSGTQAVNMGSISDFFNGRAAEPAQARMSVLQVAMNDYLNNYYYYAEGDYYAPFAVAALYEDGTVKIACHEDYQANYASAASWRNIVKIWMRGTTVFGLDQNGRLYSTNGYHTTNAVGLKDLLFIHGGVYGVCEDGTLVYIPPTDGAGEPNPVISQWKNVEKVLPFSHQYPEWGVLMLRSDGTIASSHYDGIGQMEQLQNVRDIFLFDQKPAAVQSNGTVVFREGTDSRLYGAVKLVSGYEGLIFGMTQDGQLKISGNMDFYEGSFSKPGWYTGTNTIPKSGVADLLDHEGMRSSDIVILYRDGTVFSPTAALNDVVKDWTDIVQVGWYEDYDFVVLYGLRKDGSVIAAKMPFGFHTAEVTENYLDWQLDRLYIQRFAGAVGISKDGRIVGDYAFGNVDLTVLNG